MASLRPVAWSKDQKQTSCASPQLSQQLISKKGNAVPSPAPHQHPLIARLPVELRFSPEVVKPADDTYKKDLIKHSNLSKPLANGWTLFDHQKKAILKALLMRRFILALDMGLGTETNIDLHPFYRSLFSFMPLHYRQDFDRMCLDLVLSEKL